MKSIMRCLEESLTPSQKEMQAGVEWLVNDGPRASGRTYVLAMAFIKKAITSGHAIHVWDHSLYQHRDKEYYLLRMIEKIVYMVNQEMGSRVMYLQVNRSSRTIVVNIPHPSMDKYNNWDRI